MAGERPNHLEHPNFSRGLVEVPLFKVPLDFEYHGKVRDVYGVNDRLAIITTDRTSANDERVCTIPDKGKVLNGLSAFWFDQTSDIIQNHVIDVPHPNVTIATRVDERPAVEVVVREYMAVSNTDTSIFKNYKNGRRTIYGINFPDGLQANQKFDERIVTPTTKAEDGEHDKELTDEKAKALVDGQYGWGAWDHMKDTALALFDRGSDIYSDRGLILVDTKFEFGFKDGQLMLIDEALTTDSSVHGVIIQRPLPPHFIEDEIKTAVIPEKDVDGLHPNPTFTPPLALAVMTILQEINKKEAKPSFLSRVQFLKRGKTFSHENFKKWLTSKNLVFIGRGEAGGKPIISHVEKIGIPHQVIHSKTQNREDILKTADVIITAVGKKDMVTPDMIKQGVILIGVGLHKEDGKLSGDYDEEKIRHIASFYTPTPGGVGPVNVAMLLKNVVQAAKQLH